jgi:hypothetical protein
VAIPVCDAPKGLIARTLCSVALATSSIHHIADHDYRKGHPWVPACVRALQESRFGHQLSLDGQT